jgi:hypothetical protein
VIFKLELRIIVCAVKENRRSRLAHRVVGERDPAAPAARTVGIGAVQQHVGVERSLPQQKSHRVGLRRSWTEFRTRIGILSQQTLGQVAQFGQTL